MKLHSSISKSKTFLTLEQRFNNIHNNIYNYDLVIYKNVKTKIIVTCNKHGNFNLTTEIHLKGHGCKVCKKEEKLKQTQKKKTIYFLKHAPKIHNNKYDYSLFKYISAFKDIIIICPIHGNFKQRANIHLSGSGCKKCNKILLKKIKNKKAEDKFKIKSKLIHADKNYSYSKVKWGKDNHDKVIITCIKHGDFIISQNAHILGQGFTSCLYTSSHNLYTSQPTLLYYIYFPKINKYKIGITIERSGLINRFCKAVYGDFIEIETKLFNTGKEAFIMEQFLLKKYKEYKYIGPKLLPAGNTELFNKDLRINNNKILKDTLNES